MMSPRQRRDALLADALEGHDLAVHWLRLSVLTTLGAALYGAVIGHWHGPLLATSLAFVVCFHVLLWLLALLFATRFSGEALRRTGSQPIAILWVGLFCVVSFQVATLCRPVLWRALGSPVLEGRKMFLLGQFGRIMDGPTTPRASTVQ